MKWAGLAGCGALLLLSGCLDAMVGTPCADSRCQCGPKGTCAIDGGIDGGALDSLTGEEGEAGTAPFDVTPPLDLGESLDEGSAIDGDQGEAHPIDLGRDRAPDVADVRAPDVADARAPDAGDARRTDAVDAARDNAVPDTRDAPLPDTRDVPVLIAGDDARDALDAADAPQTPADALADRADGQGDGDATTPSADASDDSLPDASDAGGGHDSADGGHDSAASGRDSADAGSDGFRDLAPPCPGLQTRCNGICLDLQSDQQNCGLCGFDCSAQVCIAGQCQPCPGNQVACGGQCMDTATNPSHCGSCGHVCPSGACRSGQCKASTAGQIVVIGHDFQTSNLAINRILGNAVFLSSSANVQLVEYVGVAGSTAMNHSHDAITQVASTLGRTVTLTSIFGTDLTDVLTSADVFLIQSQTGATNTILVQLGQSWASLLGNFVHTGGIIVVLDGSYPVNMGTAQIIDQTGLMHVSVTATATDGSCVVKTATDPVAASVPANYTCPQGSSVLAGDGTHVIEDSGQPVVLRAGF